MSEKLEWISQRHADLENADIWSGSEVFCLLYWHSTHPSSCGRGKDVFGISKCCSVLFSEHVFCMWEPTCWLIYGFEVKNERASTTNLMVFLESLLQFQISKNLNGFLHHLCWFILTGWMLDWFLWCHFSKISFKERFTNIVSSKLSLNLP